MCRCSVSFPDFHPTQNYTAYQTINMCLKANPDKFCVSISDIATEFRSPWSNPGDDFLKNLKHAKAQPESQSTSHLNFQMKIQFNSILRGCHP